ncbi:MAG: PDZ domain-containing protein [Acidobacteria bacterium]|nr:PDZ domain-containing protein [Acidobacteriota bacterium]
MNKNLMRVKNGVTTRLLIAAVGALVTGQGLAQVLTWHEVDGRTRTQRVEDRRPLDEQPYLGLYIGDELDKAGVSRCRARQMWQPGPALQADAVRRGDFILALNGTVVTSAQHFGQELDRLKPGSEARLKLRRDDKEIDVSVRVASRAEWATPLDVLRRPALGVKPDEIVPMHPGQSRFEQFLGKYLSRFRIEQPAGDLRRFLAGVVERFYSENMLARVAYAFHRPTRMVELQASITSPLAAVVDRNKGNPWAVAGPILSEAARNLDSSFAAGKLGQMDLAHPAQALKDASGIVRRAGVHLERAFEKVGAAPLDEMQTSLPALLDDAARRSPAAMRARMASLAIDYSGLFAAADSIASWSPAGEPPAAAQSVAIPKEIEGAVKGEVAAVERIDGRWYVYGGPGPNEYDLSKIDVVIDAGGDDRYRYSDKARPRIQLVVDWAGNDVYSAEGEIPGPASAMLGISVVVDHQGDDRYEGGLRSCGAGLMGVGLILDHAGNDTYKGTKWSLGFGRYGFGGIVDLEDPPSARTKGKYAYPDGSDMYLAQEASQAYGGPRGFGLILDGAGRDLYRLGGPPPVWGDRTVSYSAGQGVGYGDGLFDTGGIGVLCDLSGDDRYEAGEVSQGAGWLLGMGILYDRSGNDIYYGTRYSQGASAHGGVGILADDGGDDTYWGGIAGSWDLSLALLIDRRGNDSYQGDHRIGGLGRAGHQSIA